MKIAYLTNQYPKTSHTFIRREIEEVERCGHAVERFSIRTSTEPLVDAHDLRERARTRVLLDGGVPGLAIDAAWVLATRPLRALRALSIALRMSRRSSRGVVRHLAYFAEACTLARIATREHIDHVHAHFATNPVDVALLCRALGGPPYSFTAHGTADFGLGATESSGPLAGAGASLACKIEQAAFVVAVSDDGRRRLAEHTAVHELHKLHVVRCGLDRSFLDAPRHAIPADRRVVCVARLSHEKGLPVLLRAAARLARELLEFELVLVGDGPQRAELEALVRAEQIDAHVRFAGWQDGAAVRRTILASRALVLASHSEGLPVVIMEALALGRPVIATNVGGVGELVEPASTGWLVPPGSERALADALREALTMPPDELERRGCRGAERVTTRHDARVQGRALAQLFVDAKRATVATLRVPAARALSH